MALQMFRKSVGLDRTVESNVSQSWRTRSSRTSPMEIETDMVYDEEKNGVVV